MDRARLAQLLSEAGGGAFTACRDALLAGAHFWVAEHGFPAAHGAALYARRERLMARKGVPTSGFDAAVTALRAQGDQLIRIGAVDLDDRPYHYQLFVRDDLSAAVACLGVDLRLGFRLRQGDQTLLICDVVGEDSSSFRDGCGFGSPTPRAGSGTLSTRHRYSAQPVNPERQGPIRPPSG
ncbi:hypothetical protein [Cryptosporangium minutisporangium]|uniref:Uncharacterized protein n=1 Tax=Cryptosporangium minutisporangium TaxID=113569 RepID=A0ABP6SR05_9ACTN